MYQRVIPRDLFNEAMLLKCLGQMSLIIHNYEGSDKWGLTIEHDDSSYEGFSIDNERYSGDLSCDNITVCVAGESIKLSCGLNSREPYPLIFDEGDHEGFVFDDNGEFTGEFVDFLDYKIGE